MEAHGLRERIVVHLRTQLRLVLLLVLHVTRAPRLGEAEGTVRLAVTLHLLAVDRHHHQQLQPLLPVVPSQHEARPVHQLSRLLVLCNRDLGDGVRPVGPAVDLVRALEGVRERRVLGLRGLDQRLAEHDLACVLLVVLGPQLAVLHGLGGADGELGVVGLDPVVALGEVHLGSLLEGVGHLHAGVGVLEGPVLLIVLRALVVAAEVEVFGLDLPQVHRRRPCLREPAKGPPVEVALTDGVVGGVEEPADRMAGMVADASRPRGRDGGLDSWLAGPGAVLLLNALPTALDLVECLQYLQASAARLQLVGDNGSAEARRGDGRHDVEAARARVGRLHAALELHQHLLGPLVDGIDRAHLLEKVMGCLPPLLGGCPVTPEVRNGLEGLLGEGHVGDALLGEGADDHLVKVLRPALDAVAAAKRVHLAEGLAVVVHRKLADLADGPAHCAVHLAAEIVQALDLVEDLRAHVRGEREGLDP
mmetsp:Transcript_11594/g.46851  ORF Transcript_11594/g.46851 Transcript_11594/m.46851 type:complete len:477 (-) Transcript_11594:1979-3409(-)